MNFDRIYNMDVVNGKGIRVVLFVTGCNHKCEGCYNKSTWNPRNGTPYTEETENELIKLLSNPHVDGLTLTGGDPFYRTNHPTLLKLLQRVRATFLIKMCGFGRVTPSKPYRAIQNALSCYHSLMF